VDRHDHRDRRRWAAGTRMTSRVVPDGDHKPSGGGRDFAEFRGTRCPNNRGTR